MEDKRVINLKKYFVFAAFLFVLILSVNSFSKEGEIDRIIITDAKQLKGIWEALNIYQETSRQERINTYISPLPDSKEFESKDEHQERVNNIKKIYERRVEEGFKKEIRNEQRLKSMVFRLKFSYTPYDINQTPYRHEEERKVERRTLSTKYIKIPAAWIQEFKM